MTFKLYPSASFSDEAKDHTVFLQKAEVIESAEDLRSFVKYTPFSPGLFKDGRRRNETWLGAQCLIIDVDGGRTIEEFQRDFLGLEYSITTSKSHQKEKTKGKVVVPACDRFHVLFPLSREFGPDDAEQYRALAVSLMDRFDYIDKAPKDLGRFFFPSGKEVQVFESTGVPLDTFIWPTKHGGDNERESLLMKLRRSADAGRFEDYGSWFQLGSGLKTEGFTWQDWADLSWPDARDACRDKWDTITPDLVTMGSLRFFVSGKESGSGKVKKPATKAKSSNPQPECNAHPMIFADEEEAIAWFDERFYRVDIVGKAFVVERSQGLFYAQRLLDFHMTHINKLIVDGDQESTASKVWAIRTFQIYSKLIFNPDPSLVLDPGVLNSWPGMPFKPENNGKSESFLEFIQEVICSGDLKIYDYLMDVLAKMVREPHEKGKGGNIAVAMRGEQGVGKSFFVAVLAQLFPKECYLEVNNIDQITGQFNFQLMNKIVVFADEAVWGGDKINKGALKNLITSSTLTIRKMYVDCFETPNFIRLFIATNNDWTAPVELGDRRYLVLTVSSKRKKDREYFGQIDADLKNGGFQDLMHVLSTRDYSGRDFENELPVTDAKIDSAERGMEPVSIWYQEILTDDTPGDHHRWWGRQIEAHAVHKAYQTWAETHPKWTKTFNTFGKEFLKVSGAEKSRVRNQLENGASSKPTVYNFEDLPTMRKKFEERVGLIWNWE